MIDQASVARKRSIRSGLDTVKTESDRDGVSLAAALAKSNNCLIAFVNSKLPIHLRRHVDASDIVQSVLIVVHKRQSTFRGDSDESFRAWILQIARHQIVDNIRKLSSRSATCAEDAAILFRVAADSESPCDSIVLEEDAKALICAINELPSNVRNVVMLRYTENLTFEQIASQLHIPVSTCRRYWLNGCEDLKERLSHLRP